MRVARVLHYSQTSLIQCTSGGLFFAQHALVEFTHKNRRRFVGNRPKARYDPVGTRREKCAAQSHDTLTGNEDPTHLEFWITVAEGQFLQLDECGGARARAFDGLT